MFKADNLRQHRMTRRDVAHRLAVSVSSVRRMEGIDLHPLQDAQGTWRFDRDEIESLARKRLPRPVQQSKDVLGQVASRVFAAFEAGCDLSEIVVDLHVHPTTVRELYSEWSISLGEGERRRREELELAAERREQELAAKQRELEKLLRTRR